VSQPGSNSVYSNNKYNRKKNPRPDITTKEIKKTQFPIQDNKKRNKENPQRLPEPKTQDKPQ